MDTTRTIGMALERALSAISEEAPLVAELQAGSEEAFAYLLSVYQNPVFNLVSRILENPPRGRTFCRMCSSRSSKGFGNFTARAV